MKLLHSKKHNIIVTVVVSIFCFLGLHLSGVLENVGMAALILNWLPLIIGLVTISFYLIVYKFITFQYAWIVTTLGNLFNLILISRALVDSL